MIDRIYTDIYDSEILNTASTHVALQAHTKSIFGKFESENHTFSVFIAKSKLNLCVDALISDSLFSFSLNHVCLYRCGEL
jgi:hypothetical protein